MNTGVLIVATVWILLDLAFFAIAWLTTFTLRARNRRRIAQSRVLERQHAEEAAWQDEAELENQSYSGRTY